MLWITFQQNWMRVNSAYEWPFRFISTRNTPKSWKWKALQRGSAVHGVQHPRNTYTIDNNLNPQEDYSTSKAS